jgi:hypothetical protein
MCPAESAGLPCTDPRCGRTYDHALPCDDCGYVDCVCTKESE